MRKHDSKEFALIQLEQAITTLISIGDQTTVNKLYSMHRRANHELENAEHVARAIECLMFAVSDNLGEPERWAYEDQVELSEEEYERMYPRSKVIDAVRMFPACVQCGDAFTGHEDDTETHCRWCVTCASPSAEADEHSNAGLL
jgi:hypothetical protein